MQEASTHLSKCAIGMTLAGVIGVSLEEVEELWKEGPQLRMSRVPNKCHREEFKDASDRHRHLLRTASAGFLESERHHRGLGF